MYSIVVTLFVGSNSDSLPTVILGDTSCMFVTVRSLQFANVAGNRGACSWHRL